MVLGTMFLMAAMSFGQAIANPTFRPNFPPRATMNEIVGPGGRYTCPRVAAATQKPSERAGRWLEINISDLSLLVS